MKKIFLKQEKGRALELQESAQMNKIPRIIQDCPDEKNQTRMARTTGISQEGKKTRIHHAVLILAYSVKIRSTRILCEEQDLAFQTRILRWNV
jgi:hypothetical protein